MSKSLQEIQNTASQWIGEGRIKKAITIWEDALQTHPHDNAQIYYEIANLERQLGHYKPALKALNAHLDCLKEQKDTPSISIALAHFYIAGILDSLWRLDSAITHYQHAYDIAQTTLPAEDPSLISLAKQLNAAKEKLAQHPKNQKN